MNPTAFYKLCALTAMLAAGGCALTGGRETNDPRWSALRELRSSSYPCFLSGITYAGDDLFYAVSDRAGRLHPLHISISEKGRARKPRFDAPVTLADAIDLEGIAWDPLHKTVWASDEMDSTIREFDPVTGARRGALALPEVFRRCRANFSLEALSISPDGRELWTANEEALEGDGPIADQNAGTRVRLCRFRRADADSAWRSDGMWAYETDPMAGGPYGKYRASGLSGLMVADDGTPYALEREFSQKFPLPSFRIRIYQIDVSEADDVSRVDSLKDASVRLARKSLVFDEKTGSAMYEGCCFGPAVASGRLVVLCADGDDTLAHAILYLAAP